MHCIPGSFRGLGVRYASDLKHGENCSVESLTATLKGVSKSRVSTQDGAQSQAHESEIIFFETEDQAQHSDRLLDLLHCASFEFRFPEDPLYYEHYPLVPPFDDVEPQLLPPSGNYGSGNSIEYFYEICLTAGNDTKRMVRKIKKNIDFTPTRAPQALDMPLSTITNQIEFMDAAEPTRQFQMIFDLEYPTVVAQREPFTLNLILKSTPSPDIFLHSWTVQLVESTCASVPDTLKEHWMTDYTLGSEVHINDLDTRPLVNASPITVLEDLTVPGTCAVSFSTPNLQRTYSLQVVVVLQCGDQSQEMLYKTENVTLLGAEIGSDGKDREYDEAYDEDIHGPLEMLKGKLLPPAYLRRLKYRYQVKHMFE